MLKESGRKLNQKRRNTAGGQVGTSRNEVTAEAIRARAYEIYVARGGAPGDPVEDWLQAERELRAMSGADRLDRGTP